MGGTQEDALAHAKAAMRLWLETAEEFGVPGNYVAGANIAGFQRVASAMSAFGLV